MFKVTCDTSGPVFNLYDANCTSQVATQAPISSCRQPWDQGGGEGAWETGFCVDTIPSLPVGAAKLKSWINEASCDVPYKAISHQLPGCFRNQAGTAYAGIRSCTSTNVTYVTGCSDNTCMTGCAVLPIYLNSKISLSLHVIALQYVTLTV
jgi:hypothetical protein